MKRSLLVGLVSVGVGLTVWAFAAADQPAEKSQTPNIRVGTFDSRAVALAHFGNMIKEGWLKNLYAEHAKAKEAGDQKLVKELEAKAQARQKRLHHQVFGTAPVNDAFKRIEKDIPKVADSAGVHVIISVHDVVYQSPSAGFVDVTDRMVQLFDPDEETLKKIEAIRKHPPVSDEVIENMECRPPEKESEADRPKK